MSRLFFYLCGFIMLMVLTACGGIDKEDLWAKVDNAIEDVDCETALTSLEILLDNKDALEESELDKARSLNRTCISWRSALRQLEEEDYIRAASSYGRALDSLDPQLELYEIIAAEVVTLYDTTPMESFFTKCGVEYKVYEIPEVIFYDAGLIDEETHQAAERACMNRLIEDIVYVDGSRLVNISRFEDVYAAQMAVFESTLPPDEFAALKSNYEQQLMVTLDTFATSDSKRNTVQRWIDDADFLDDSVRDDFFAQAAYQKALGLYEDAIEADIGYGLAVEALEAFITEYPEHELIEDVETMLAEAKDGLERVGINDDGKIAMFYQNGTPYEVQLTFEWNHSNGTFLDREDLYLPPCENCTRTSGCIISSPIEPIRLIPQDYIVSINIMDASVYPSGGRQTIDQSSTMCISLSSDFLSGSGLTD